MSPLVSLAKKLQLVSKDLPLCKTVVSNSLETIDFAVRQVGTILYFLECLKKHSYYRSTVRDEIIVFNFKLNFTTSKTMLRVE